MNNLKFILVFIILFFVSLNSFASDLIKFEGSGCVDKPVDEIYTLLNQYDKYPAIDDQNLSQFPNHFGTLDVNWVEVLYLPLESLQRSSDLYSRVKKVGGSLIFARFRPIFVKEYSKNRHAQMILHCYDIQRDQSSFDFVCEQVAQEKKHYGLTHVKIRIQADSSPEATKFCWSSPVVLRYFVELKVNSQHVKEMKDAVVAGLLGSQGDVIFSGARVMVDMWFEEEEFFKSYFKSFYDYWIKYLSL